MKDCIYLDLDEFSRQISSSDGRSCGIENFERFIEKSHSKYFRLIGTSNNWNIISSLIFMRSKGLIDNVEVCSPYAHPSLISASLEEKFRCAKENVKFSPSIGGWRRPVDIEYYSFGFPTSNTSDWLMRHPVWPALAFLKYFNESKAAQLVKVIVDPRFFVRGASASDDPNSRSHLESRFGFPSHSSLKSNYECLTDTWMCLNYSDKSLQEPGSFFMRYYLGHKLGKTQAAKATNRKFLDFICGNWISWTNRTNNVEPPFDPDLFFDDASTSVAWKAHLSKFLVLS